MLLVTGFHGEPGWELVKPEQSRQAHAVSVVIGVETPPLTGHPGSRVLRSQRNALKVGVVGGVELGKGRELSIRLPSDWRRRQVRYFKEVPTRVV